MDRFCLFQLPAWPDTINSHYEIALILYPGMVLFYCIFVNQV